jgi:hypothetical protein
MLLYQVKVDGALGFHPGVQVKKGVDCKKLKLSNQSINQF